jgi:hypothetical protein
MTSIELLVEQVPIGDYVLPLSKADIIIPGTDVSKPATISSHRL